MKWNGQAQTLMFSQRSSYSILLDDFFFLSFLSFFFSFAHEEDQEVRCHSTGIFLRLPPLAARKPARAPNPNKKFSISFLGLIGWRVATALTAARFRQSKSTNQHLSRWGSGGLGGSQPCFSHWGSSESKITWPTEHSTVHERTEQLMLCNFSTLE